MPKWNVTDDRFVGFFDIMGFKERVSRDTHQEVLEKMERLRLLMTPIEEAHRTSSHKKKRASIQEGGWKYSIVRPVLFSDSILLVSEDCSEGSAAKILFCAAWLIAQGLIAQIPIRGALAYGKQTANFEKSIYFGQPLIDAHNLQEELCLYGAVLHHSMEQLLKQKNMQYVLSNTNDFIVNYDVPLKTCTVKHYCVQWLDGFRVLDEDALSTVSEFYGTASGNVRKYIDNTTRFIKDNNLPLATPKQRRKTIRK
jgi:hypothetical protein